jgi:hypothetical protein
LGKFLVSNNFPMEVERIRTWVEVGGGLDHLPIIIQIEKYDSKPITPKFKHE